MIKNKLNLASLCVAFCFFGCGGIQQSQYDNILNDLSQTRLDYKSCDNILECFYKNAQIEFDIKIAQAKAQHSSEFNSRNDSQKEKTKWENELRKIDNLQDFIDSAQSEYNNIPKDKIPQFPTNISNYLTENIYTSDSKTDLKPEIFCDSLAFGLVSKAIVLMMLFPDRFDIIKDTFYGTYNSVVKQLTGLEIDFKGMCENSSTYGHTVSILQGIHKNFKILIGLAIVVIENYAFLNKKVSSNEPATLHKIFHDNSGSTKVLISEKDEAYMMFLDSVKAYCEKANNIMKPKLEPFIIINNDITKSKQATIRTVRELINNENDILDFSKIFTPNGKGISVRKDNNFVSIDQNGKLIINRNSINTRMENSAVLIEKLIGKSPITLFYSSVDKINKEAEKMKKTDPSKTALDITIPSLKI